MKEKLYKAEVNFFKHDVVIEMKLTELKVLKAFDYVIQTKDYQSITDLFATKQFEQDMLDKEYKLSDTNYVYYSTDIGKCIKWFEKIKQIR